MAVIIPIEEYEELIENLHNPVIVAECRDEFTIPFGKLEEKLRTDGLSWN